jgi:hypothetical protein
MPPPDQTSKFTFYRGYWYCCKAGAQAWPSACSWHDTADLFKRLELDNAPTLGDSASPVSESNESLNGLDHRLDVEQLLKGLRVAVALGVLIWLTLVVIAGAIFLTS